MLVMLILDGRLEGRIDGVHKVLVIQRAMHKHSPAMDIQHMLQEWSAQISALAIAISSKQGAYAV